MDLPTEVCTIVLSYLHLNDLIEMSATCKFFYRLLRENKIFIKKMNESNRLFNCKGWFCDYYYDMCFSFSSRLTVCLIEHVYMKNLIEAKSIVLDRLFHAILPFRVNMSKRTWVDSIQGFISRIRKYLIISIRNCL